MTVKREKKGEEGGGGSVVSKESEGVNRGECMSLPILQPISQSSLTWVPCAQPRTPGTKTNIYEGMRVR
jgi:hypothetical protein